MKFNKSSLSSGLWRKKKMNLSSNVRKWYVSMLIHKKIGNIPQTIEELLRFFQKMTKFGYYFSLLFFNFTHYYHSSLLMVGLGSYIIQRTPRIVTIIQHITSYKVTLLHLDGFGKGPPVVRISAWMINFAGFCFGWLTGLATTQWITLK